MTKYLILGAGPAGLALANSLLDRGETDFLVVEKEAEAGGLCRSKQVDGSPLDIGGGHFLDVRRPAVNEFLFRFMPEEEWDSFVRDSRISLPFAEISHPFEANIWQMPQDKQVEYLKSIAVAGCNLGTPMPEAFTDWIVWKLGDKIARDYMIPYNQKMFGRDLDQLGTYWLEKLPSVSFEETLLSCLNRKAYGTQPGHARFYYPRKYGYGELWLRMAARLGDKIILGNPVEELDLTGPDPGVTLSDGTRLSAGTVVTSIPWTAVRVRGLPERLSILLSRLRHTSVNVTYMEDAPDTPAQWVYYPDPALDYHRILVRKNFCAGARGCWTETNSDRFHPEKEPGGGFSYRNEYAYPLNTRDKPSIMRELLSFAKARKVIGLGRWGEWEHYNSDLTVARALELSRVL